MTGALSTGWRTRSRRSFRAFAETLGLAADATYMESKIRMLTFFRNAPACVVVYMTRMDYYDAKMLAALTAHGYSYDDVMRLYGEPDLLSLGAAIQNFLSCGTRTRTRRLAG
jgi:hypothetical protein